MTFLRWLKSTLLLILALPFLLVAAAGIAIALFAGLVGVIGILLLGMAGIYKIDFSRIKNAVEQATIDISG